MLFSTTNQFLFLLFQVNHTFSFNRSYATPTSTRLDEVYVLVYVNIARLLIQGIIPFACLIFFNYRTNWALKRRRIMRNRPLPMTNPQAILGQAGNDNQLTNQQKKAHEAQQATVLFVIVANFFICHTLRFALNLHEFLTLDSIRAFLTDDACVSFSYGGFCAVSISHCLMTLNSSVNFFIYACTSSNFVKVSWIKVVDLKCIQFLIRLKNDVFDTNDSNDVVFVPQVSPPNELNNTRNTRIISDSSYRQPAVDPCFV